MRKLSAEEAAQYDNMIKGAQQMSLEDLQQGRLFGYCRISTPKQKLQRQIDNIKAKYPDAVAVIAAMNGDALTFVACAGAEAVRAGAHAGNILREIAAICGGKGGGRPDNAMAGGKDLSRVDEALAAVEEKLPR